MRILAALLMTALPALADEPPPGLVSAELLPGWITAEGHRMTALRLELEPGWKTYWRSPGDAGVPPRFDWQGSQNLGPVRVLWPRPEVIDSGGERTLGYHDRLILPIEITPTQPGQPVAPRVVVDFGLCLDICVPAQVRLTAPAPGDAPDPLIEAALARQPRASDRQPECRVQPIKDGMQVTATLPSEESALAEDVAMELAGKDIWVSAPETSAEGARVVAQADFVAASGKPFPLDPAALRLTLIGPEDAVEFRGCRPES
ncbi:protein-disulfide reductase DsbD domain-containing protein [Paracoccus sp. DMF]|uniref:protein-disulfide reductase DsbD domain-containing protein n=1 Tax=Paracoccus sp. DMF TaxID=400837 RepID=UPI0021E39A28|nr:protein-disulfide reductase DsbD domain-containing protein [Paracoccus sp. DMF]MCV2446733.1 protein-disulfide reductase DsbD family protein [Paracoccus sp. DMF]